MRMKEMKYTILVLQLAMMFPIITLIERLIPVSDKILMTLFVTSLIIYILKKSMKIKTFLFFLFFFTSYLISCCLTTIDAFMSHVNMAFYLPCMILFYFFMIDNKNTISNDLYEIRKYIMAIILLYCIIMFLSIFSSSAYVTIDGNLWNGNKYFASFSNSPNRVGPASLFINILIIHLASIKYKHNFLPMLAILQMYPAFMGGSRIYLILIFLSELVFMYVWLDNKRLFIFLLIPGILLFAYILMRSNTGAKFLSGFSNGINIHDYEFWRKVTNSRSVMWEQRINDYILFGLPNKIFGSGINFTTYKYGLWSHNDFIEILCSFGIVGLINYLYCIYTTIRIMLKNVESSLLKALAVLIWFVNAFINFFYVYTNAMLCFPFLLLSLDYFDKSIKAKKEIGQ